jgi:FkbM family methyltransferase
MSDALWIDELALAGPEHLDPSYVERYDRKARIDPDADLAELRDLVGAHATLVDVGAGTGTFAVAAARLFARVVAVDVSPAMVAAARRKVKEHGADNVEVVEAGFLSYRHTNVPADAVYTRNALHHLPDFWKAVALRRVAEMLRRDGVLRLRDLVFAFDLRDAERHIAAWLETGAASPEEGWTREELEVHLRDEHSTFSWLLDPMLEQAGFEIERADYGHVPVYADYVCRLRR